MLLSLLRRFLNSYRGPLALVVLFQLIGSLANLYLPSLNAQIIDDGVVQGDIGYIWRTGALMLVISLVGVSATITAVFFGARTAMAFGRDVRGAIFDRALSFSAREVNHFGAPTLITRNTNDVQQVQMLVLMSCTMVVTAPITMVGGVIMALREDVGLAWLIAVAVPVLAISVASIVVRMGPLFRQMQERLDVVNRVLREQITGIRVVRAFVREPFETDRFARANHDLTDVALRVGRLMALMFPVVMLIMNLSSAAVVWFGGMRVDAGNMEIGSMTAFLAYLVQILMSVMMATFLLMVAPRAAVSAERITEVLRTESTVVTAANAVTETAGTGEVSFNHAEFSYPGADEPVLKDITFTARAGQTTAVIGSTGAGKTTLVSVIPRLFDLTDGSVTVEGVEIRDLEPELLWSKVGLVPQRPYLFTGTIASNLRYGNPEATEEELWDALHTAQAAEFVAEMPGGLDASIAQGGTNVSGGQRQRLSIARALVKKPEIYIFDDSFSALDVTTDAQLRAALEQETTEAVVIIVGQRVSTIADADQIIVLDDGEIVGIGTHDQLRENNPTYAEIVDSQLSAEEAAA